MTKNWNFWLKMAFLKKKSLFYNFPLQNVILYWPIPSFYPQNGIDIFSKLFSEKISAADAKFFEKLVVFKLKILKKCRFLFKKLILFAIFAEKLFQFYSIFKPFGSGSRTHQFLNVRFRFFGICCQTLEHNDIQALKEVQNN